MSTNEMVENDNPFAWAWALGTEEATGEGYAPMPNADTLADDDTCRTEALSHARYDGAYQAGPSSGRSLGLNGPTGLLGSDAASAEPDLVSGCRIIERKEPRSRRKHDPKELHGQRYVCLWSPCESRRAFAWPAELQRHYNDKHVHTKVYRCTALVHSKLCGKEYYRTDKFRNHIVTDHPVETEFFCPIDLCEAGPYTSDLLRVHVTEHGEADYKSYKKCSTWCRLFKEYGSICPVEDCGTKTSFVISHLLSHDLNTRYINREAIRGAGYCEVSLRPLCPICRFSIEDKWGEFYVEETGRNVFLRGATLHMYRSHWHEPENLHKHRRDILKIDPAFDWHGFIKDKVFKDILATVSTQE